MPGGRSPLTELTLAQARGLERALAEAGPVLPVFVGMRNWHPFLHETLAEMASKGGGARHGRARDRIRGPVVREHPVRGRGGRSRAGGVRRSPRGRAGVDAA